MPSSRFARFLYRFLSAPSNPKLEKKEEKSDENRGKKGNFNKVFRKAKSFCGLVIQRTRFASTATRCVPQVVDRGFRAQTATGQASTCSLEQGRSEGELTTRQASQEDARNHSPAHCDTKLELSSDGSLSTAGVHPGPLHRTTEALVVTLLFSADSVSTHAEPLEGEIWSLTDTSMVHLRNGAVVAKDEGNSDEAGSVQGLTGSGTAIASTSIIGSGDRQGPHNTSNLRGKLNEENSTKTTKLIDEKSTKNAVAPKTECVAALDSTAVVGRAFHHSTNPLEASEAVCQTPSRLDDYRVPTNGPKKQQHRSSSTSSRGTSGRPVTPHPGTPAGGQTTIQTAKDNTQGRVTTFRPQTPTSARRTNSATRWGPHDRQEIPKVMLRGRSYTMNQTNDRMGYFEHLHAFVSAHSGFADGAGKGINVASMMVRVATQWRLAGFVGKEWFHTSLLGMVTVSGLLGADSGLDGKFPEDAPVTREMLQTCRPTLPANTWDNVALRIEFMHSTQLDAWSSYLDGVVHHLLFMHDLCATHLLQMDIAEHHKLMQQKQKVRQDNGNPDTVVMQLCPSPFCNAHHSFQRYEGLKRHHEEMAEYSQQSGSNLWSLTFDKPRCCGTIIPNSPKAQGMPSVFGESCWCSCVYQLLRFEMKDAWNSIGDWCPLIGETRESGPTIRHAFLWKAALRLLCAPSQDPDNLHTQHAVDRDVIKLGKADTLPNEDVDVKNGIIDWPAVKRPGCATEGLEKFLHFIHRYRGNPHVQRGEPKCFHVATNQSVTIIDGTTADAPSLKAALDNAEVEGTVVVKLSASERASHPKRLLRSLGPFCVSQNDGSAPVAYYVTSFLVEDDGHSTFVYIDKGRWVEADNESVFQFRNEAISERMQRLFTGIYLLVLQPESKATAQKKVIETLHKAMGVAEGPARRPVTPEAAEDDDESQVRQRVQAKVEALRAEEAEVERLMKELEQRKRNTMELIKRQTEAEVELTREEGSLANVERRREETRANLQRSQEQTRELSQQMQMSEEEIKRMRHTIAEQEAQYKQHQNQLETLRTGAQQAMRDGETAANDLRQKQWEADEQQRLYEDRKREHEWALHQLAKQREQMQDEQNRIHALIREGQTKVIQDQMERDRHNKEIEKLWNQLRGLTEQIQMGSQQQSEQQQQWATEEQNKQRALQELQVEVDKLRARARDRKKKAREAEDRTKKAEAEHQSLRANTIAILKRARGANVYENSADVEQMLEDLEEETREEAHTARRRLEPEVAPPAAQFAPPRMQPFTATPANSSVGTNGCLLRSARDYRELQPIDPETEEVAHRCISITFKLPDVEAMVVDAEDPPVACGSCTARLRDDAQCCQQCLQQYCDAHIHDHLCEHTTECLKLETTCRCCGTRGTTTDVECAGCAYRIHLRCATEHKGLTLCLKCHPVRRGALLARTHRCCSCDVVIDTSRANRCGDCGQFIHYGCAVVIGEVGMGSRFRCSNCVHHLHSQRRLHDAAREERATAMLRNAAKAADAFRQRQRIDEEAAAKRELRRQDRSACPSKEKIDESTGAGTLTTFTVNTNGFYQSEGSNKLTPILLHMGVNCIPFAALSELHTTDANTGEIIAVVEQHGYRVKLAPPGPLGRDGRGTWGSALVYHKDFEFTPKEVHFTMGSVVAGVLKGDGRSISVASVYLPPCGPAINEETLVRELQQLRGVDICMGDFNADLPGLPNTADAMKLKRGVSIEAIGGRIINSPQSTMVKGKTAAANDLIILQDGRLLSRGTYIMEGHAPSDHEMIAACIGLGMMPFDRKTNTAATIRWNKLLTEEFQHTVLPKLLRDEYRTLGTFDTTKMGLNRGMKQVIHFASKIGAYAPRFRRPNAPQDVAEQAQRYREIFEAHTLALEKATGEPPDVKEAMEQKAEIDRATALKDLLNEAHRRTVHRFYKMGPAKLYDMFASGTSSNREAFILGADGNRLPTEKAAEEFLKEFNQKCEVRPTGDDILKAPPVDWGAESKLSRAKFPMQAEIPQYSEHAMKELLGIRGEGGWRKATTADLYRFTAHEVHMAIQQHPDTTSQDPDGLALPLLQLIPLGPFHEYLAAMYTECMRKCKVPDAWKRSVLTPVFKEGGKAEGMKKNYRPVAATSYISRTWERLMIGRMESKLATLHNAQFGYLRGRTPEQLLGYMARNLHNIVNSTYKGKRCVAGAISFDCTDAFCKITPAAAEKALRRLSFDGTITSVIVDWLTDRKQAVKLGSHLTQFADVKAGLPQGSVLGPILWVIVMDDLLCRLSRTSKGHLRDSLELTSLQGAFADDLTLLTGGISRSAVKSSLERWSGEAVRWFHEMGIPISETKTKASFFTRQREEAPVHRWAAGTDPNQAVIRHMTQPGSPPFTVRITNDGLTILGVHFSPDGTCREHLEGLIRHLRDVRRHLDTIGRYVQPAMLWDIYQQQGLSTLRYGATATWHQGEDPSDPGTKFPRIHQVVYDPVSDPCGTLRDELEKEHQRCCRSILLAPEIGPKLLSCRLEANMLSVDSIMEEHKARSLAKLWARPAADIGGLIDGLPTQILCGIPTRLRELNQPTLQFLPYQPQDAALAMSRVTFHTEGAPPFRKPAEEDMSDEQREILRAINEDRIEAARAALGGTIDTIVATDGSVSKDPGDSHLYRAASGAIVWNADGRAVQAECASRRQMKIAPSTYTVEGGAGVRGLQLVRRGLGDSTDGTPTIMWLLDARSHLDAMKRGPARARDIFTASAWGELTALALAGAKIAVVHIYSHVGQQHNEMVDRLVGDTSEGDGEECYLTAEDVANGMALEHRRKDAWRLQNQRLQLGARSTLSASCADLMPIPKIGRLECKQLMELRLGTCSKLGGAFPGSKEDCYRCFQPDALSFEDSRAVRHMFTCGDNDAIAARRRHLGESEAEASTPALLWTRPTAALRYARDFWAASHQADQPQRRGQRAFGTGVLPAQH